MLANIVSQYGPPSLLELKEVEKPTPKGKELLIKIYATTVNRTDVALIRAIPLFARLATGLLKPKKPIPGTEFAGQIESIGAEVTTFKIGDQVCGFNDGLFGAHAQYMLIAEDQALTLMPPNLTYQQATCTEGGHYAYNLIRRLKLGDGSKVLINGATGGIGSAAVQLLKYLGAHVTGTCRAEHMDLVKSIGADVVIDYENEDFTKIDQKFDFILDAVGKSTFGACKPLLNSKGIYSSSDLGPWSQNVLFALTTPYLPGPTVRFPLPLHCRDDIIFLRKVMEEGKFHPLIDRVYPFEQIKDAYEYVELAQKVGNVIITVAE